MEENQILHPFNSIKDCPKCGAGEKERTTTFQKSSLRRNCQRCTYQWFERCKDDEEKQGDTVNLAEIVKDHERVCINCSEPMNQLAGFFCLKCMNKYKQEKKGGGVRL